MTAIFASHLPRSRKDQLIEALGWTLSCAAVTAALAGTLLWADRRSGTDAGSEAAIILELDLLPPVSAVPAPPPAPPASAAPLLEAPSASQDDRMTIIPTQAQAVKPPTEVPLPEQLHRELPLTPVDPPPLPPEATMAEVAAQDLDTARSDAGRDRKRNLRMADAAPPPSAESTSVRPQSSAVSRVGVKDALSRWGAAIRKKVERRKAYPKAARGAQGEVVVKMTISRAGTLQALAVARSSGNAVLDEAALDAVRRAGRFPAAPEVFSGAQHLFSLPIRFAP